MTRHSNLISIVAAAVLISAVVSSLVTYKFAKHLESDDVYLVGSATITNPERLPEYQAIAGPLAEQTGGYVPLAFSAPEMIEGTVPTQGLMFVERYDSMEGLEAFINSEEFAEAKKLRNQIADVHFMLILDAYSH